ncbi:MAG: hypothetical protein C0404_09720 [Verrucomicrobia bacterium]|nr:hypothetical protein [Verrucomicrobiota bacterium]
MKMLPSPKEKKEFVLRAHASHSFLVVRDICEQILNKPIPASDPLYHPLMIAIYTTYGRPFTNCRGIGKLPEAVVPDAFKALHQDLITYRNKIYAHADKDMVHRDYGPANELRVSVSPQGRCRCWTQRVEGSLRQVRDILKLARRMEQTMAYWTDRFKKKYMEKMDVEPGDYLIDMESPTELLQRRDAEQVNRERFLVNRATSLCGLLKTPHS